MAFQIADPSIDDKNFLTVFKDRGCYLTDLCPEPVDHLGPDERRASRKDSEMRLATQLKLLRPAMIVSVLRSILTNVENATSLADWQVPMIQVPYPGRWSRHREAFIKALVPVIQRLNA